ncbi:cell adhesion molecule [Lithospermum erythrorhizon]|uniref:Cell adhesion molecule n=1 Tax=Lithospermum erythrorhizon TaxID=34254 RepID=A0AAV3P5R1_LITER
MSPSTITRSLLFATVVVLICFKTSGAENIVQVMKGYPDFSKMTEILSQPDITKQIKIQYAITVLALDNDIMDTLSGKRPEEVVDIVKCHVLLDYYDDAKLKNRPLNKPAEMVNLYQSSGSSQYGQGLIQLKRTSQGIFFYSSSENSTQNNAKYVEKIYNRQFNVSILRIDHPVIVMGLNEDMAKAPAPVPTKGLVPAPEPAEAPEEVVADSPSDESDFMEAPAPAPTPEEAADAPDGEPDKAADADDSANEDQAATASAGKRVVGLTLVLASAFLAAVSY